MRHWLFSLLAILFVATTAHGQDVTGSGNDWLLVNTNSAGELLLGTTGAQDIRLVAGQSGTAVGFTIDGTTGVMTGLGGADLEFASAVDEKIRITSGGGADADIVISIPAASTNSDIILDSGTGAGSTGVFIRKGNVDIATFTDTGLLLDPDDSLIYRDEDADRLLLAGGTLANPVNGAIVDIRGDDFGGADAGGGIFLTSGNNAAGSDIGLNASDQITLTAANGISVAAGTDIDVGDEVGWTGTSSANQACTTTCAAGCLGGFDTGTSVFVSCSDATADTCLCDG